MTFYCIHYIMHPLTTRLNTGSLILSHVASTKCVFKAEMYTLCPLLKIGQEYAAHFQLKCPYYGI